MAANRLAAESIPSAMTDELRHLLDSLDDLDREYRAGDLDRADYDTLRNDYTVRIADAMRQAPQSEDSGSGRPTPSSAAAESRSTAPSTGPRTTGRRWRPWLLVGAAVLVFAVGAGVLVARTAGERGVGDALTGSVNETSRERTFECQQMGTGGDVVGALECFDEVLTSDPENVQALTYRGWFLVLAASSAAQTEGAGDQAVELMASAGTYLDRAVSIDPTFPDARAFRAVFYDRLGQSDLACAEVADLLALDPPPFFVNQTSALAERNGC